MDKSNKELALEAAIEYTKSWNSSHDTKPMKVDDFCKTIKSIYSTLNNIDDSDEH